MAAKKLFHIGMIVDGALLYELMALADGKAHDLQVRALAASKQLGNGTARVPARTVMLPWFKDNPTFTGAEAAAYGASVGVTKTTVNQLTSALVKEKLLKRTAPATFAATEKLFEAAKVIA